MATLGISFTFALKADAGSGIEQPMPESKPEKPVVSIVATPNNKNWGNWEIWSQPYWLNSNICRKNAANIICLTPEQAKIHRWSIPALSGSSSKD